MARPLLTIKFELGPYDGWNVHSDNPNEAAMMFKTMSAKYLAIKKEEGGQYHIYECTKLEKIQDTAENTITVERTYEFRKSSKEQPHEYQGSWVQTYDITT